MHHAVVLAIQEGYIQVPVDTRGDSDIKMTPMENAAVRLAALGWSSDEIADNYQKSPDTVRRYYEDAREKFGVKTLSHLMRKAFEYGIFKVGEPIDYPKDITEAELNLLQIHLSDSLSSAKELGLTHPHELEVLSLLPDLGKGVFVRSDMYKLGFYQEAPSPSARAQAYGRAIASVSRKLETIFGQPIIQNVGRKNRVYAIRQPLSVGQPDGLRPTPTFHGEYISPGRMKVKKAPKLKLVRDEEVPKKADRPDKPQVKRSSRSSSSLPGIRVFAD